MIGVLAAVVLVMGLTVIGYPRFGPVEITLLGIPVAIGAMMVGPTAGLILGAFFGLTSVIQAFMGSPFGTLLLGINPFLTILLCMIPRCLMGWLCGYIFRFLSKRDKTGVVSFVVTALSAALLNTVFFVGFFLLFFRNAGTFLDMTVLDLILMLVTTNAIIEAVVCTLVAASIAKGLVHFLPGRGTNRPPEEE